MEVTITQNGALYFAHCKVSKRRAAFFWPLHTRANKQGPDGVHLRGKRRSRAGTIRIVSSNLTPSALLQSHCL